MVAISHLLKFFPDKSVKGCYKIFLKIKSTNHFIFIFAQIVSCHTKYNLLEL